MPTPALSHGMPVFCPNPRSEPLAHSSSLKFFWHFSPFSPYFFYFSFLFFFYSFFPFILLLALFLLLLPLRTACSCTDHPGFCHHRLPPASDRQLLATTPWPQARATAAPCVLLQLHYCWPRVCHGRPSKLLATFLRPPSTSIDRSLTAPATTTIRRSPLATTRPLL